MKRFSIEEMVLYVVCFFKYVIIVSVYLCFRSVEELNVKFCKSIFLYR